MDDEGANQWKRQNAFGVFVDKPLGYPSSSSTSSSVADAEHDHKKKLKTNSAAEAPFLSTLDQQQEVLHSIPLPNLLVSAFKENPKGAVKFQLFVSRSYTPSTSTSTSSSPVYTLKVRSASNNSSGEVECAGNNIVDGGGGATPVVTETRLVAEGHFSLRSRL